LAVPVPAVALTTFRAGDDEFRVDLVKEVRWYMEEGPKFEGMAALDAVRDRLANCHKVWLNDTQADAYLHALNTAYRDLKKKQHEELS
jgi:hypothetical protein